MKVCNTCKEEKSFEKFRYRVFPEGSNRKPHLDNKCKDCVAAESKEKYLASKGTQKYKDMIERKRLPKNIRVQRNYRLLNLYKMSLEEYENQLLLQGGGCYICQKTPEENGKNLAVDHDHKCCPGAKTCGNCVRKLLCDRCNLTIAKFDDSIELVEKVLKYFKEHQ